MSLFFIIVGLNRSWGFLMLVFSISPWCVSDSAHAVDVLERDYSRDRLWCLLVLSLDDESDSVHCPEMWNTNFSPTQFSSYFDPRKNDLRITSTLHIMCLIMLMMLRVATSESMNSRPCFQELTFLDTFATCSLAAIFISDYKTTFYHHCLG